MLELRVHMYAPRRSDTIVRKSLNSSIICITKCVNYHSSIMEDEEFNEIGMVVLHIPCNSDRQHFMHFGLHPTSSSNMLSLQDILS
jgi:hypothetical protein